MPSCTTDQSKITIEKCCYQLAFPWNYQTLVLVFDKVCIVLIRVKTPSLKCLVLEEDADSLLQE